MESYKYQSVSSVDLVILSMYTTNMSSAYLAALFLSVSQNYNLPTQLLSALCYVESTHKVSAYHMDDGNSPSLGICQVKLGTARLLGFRGTEEQLMAPEVNIEYAGKYLNKQLSRYNQDVHKAVSAYNAGTWMTNDKGETKNRKYVAKVFKALQERR